MRGIEGNALTVDTRSVDDAIHIVNRDACRRQRIFCGLKLHRIGRFVVRQKVALRQAAEFFGAAFFDAEQGIDFGGRNQPRRQSFACADDVETEGWVRMSCLHNISASE